MKVKLGDVLIYSHARSVEHYRDLAELTYFSHPWRRLKEEALRDTYLRSTVFAWVVQNITEATAESLHEALLSDAAYLGMHAVDLSNPVQMVLYNHSLVGAYRIRGDVCNIFYSMGDEESKDLYEADALKGLGFEHIAWEDTGAHGTIFDDYDTVDHFQRVESFRRLVAAALPGGEDEADELVLVLEDLSPRLFSTLGACAHAVHLGTHAEDFAQAAISARRYLEQLADALFPAQSSPHKGRDVTKGKVRNRLWAFIDDSIPAVTTDRAKRISALGTEVDRLIEEVNRAVHGTAEKDRLVKAISDIASLSAGLLGLAPEATRKPYYAFHDSILDFFDQVLGR